MFKPTKLKSLAAVAGACIAMLSSAPAHAGAYALSHLNIKDFILDIQPTVVTTIGQFSFDLANTATLKGNSAAPSAASCFGTVGFNNCGASPVLDAAMVNAPGSSALRSENVFAFLGTLPAGVNSYAGADSVITTAELVTGTPTSLEQISEVLLNSNGGARANAEIQSNTSLTISFSIVGGPATLDLSFMADPDQMADISGPLGAYLSQSNMNASITLQKTGGGEIRWTPQGTASNDCQVSVFALTSCAETFDSEDLNNNASTGVNPSTRSNSFDVADIFTRFGIHVDNLEAGDYTVALNSLTSTSVSRAVPEPGSLALIGVALLGLGLGASRRKVKLG